MLSFLHRTALVLAAESEPNDTLATADSLTLASWRNGSLNASTDTADGYNLTGVDGRA